MTAVRTGTLLIAVATAASLASCASTGGPAASPTSSTPSGPSGSLGVVTQEDAAAAIEGLCRVRETFGSDPAGAASTFENDVHQELHVIAAATETVDRTAAGALLQTKERVESDLAEDLLPTSFGADVDALIAATSRALQAIGLGAPACGA